jgi:hypothetical protein
MRVTARLHTSEVNILLRQIRDSSARSEDFVYETGRNEYRARITMKNPGSGIQDREGKIFSFCGVRFYNKYLQIRKV